MAPLGKFGLLTGGECASEDRVLCVCRAGCHGRCKQRGGDQRRGEAERSEPPSECGAVL